MIKDKLHGYEIDWGSSFSTDISHNVCVDKSMIGQLALHNKFMRLVYA